MFGNSIAAPKAVLSHKERIQAKLDAEAQKSARAASNRASILNHQEEKTISEVATIETTASFRNRGIVMVDIYRRAENAPVNPKAKQNLNGQDDNEQFYNGFLSPATRRNVERLLSVWLTAIELEADLKKNNKEVNAEKVFSTFVTLTLPCSQIHTDNTIKEVILHPFINWLKENSNEVYKHGQKKGQKKGFGVECFFWRAEPQKNTNIHFHVICDKYVPWECIREKWNQSLERLGYVSRYAMIQARKYKDGFVLNKTRYAKDVEEFKSITTSAINSGIVPDHANNIFKGYLKVAVLRKKLPNDKMFEQCAIEQQKITYQKALDCGFMNPPSTEIRAIQHLESVAAYVIKYVAKKPIEKALKPNQEIKVNSEGKTMLYTYEYINHPDGEVEPVVAKYEEYKPKFEERKINGRIWGCADKLRGFKAKDGDQVEVDECGRTFLVETNTQESVEPDINLSIKKPVATMKYFSKVVGYKEVFLTSQGHDSKIFVSPVIDEDITTLKYINKMREFVGEHELEAIKKRIGPAFEKMRGEIIPLRPEKMGYKPKSNGKPAITKHADILRDYAPELYLQYKAYYEHIFNCIYRQAA